MPAKLSIKGQEDYTQGNSKIDVEFSWYCNRVPNQFTPGLDYRDQLILHSICLTTTKEERKEGRKERRKEGRKGGREEGRKGGRKTSPSLVEI